MKDVIIALAFGLVLTWVGLVIALMTAKPKGSLLREAMRLLPDVIRLLRRLATYPNLPRPLRRRIGWLFAYLALPFDLIPDFIPALGFADDAIIAVWVLRSVISSGGTAAVRDNWPGTAQGLDAVFKVCGMNKPHSR